MKRCLCLASSFVLILSSCTTTTEESGPEAFPERCAFLAKHVDWSMPIPSLNTVSELFRNACYRETIDVGMAAKKNYTDKTYSFVKESMELFVAEGTVTDYVLESYERGYLTFLIAASYLHLHQTPDVWIELNRFYHEEVAAIYNHGQDPVNTMLQAAMWDNFPREGFSARPFWLWISNNKGINKNASDFAKQRVQDIDAKKPSPTWQISEAGDFPRVYWSMKFLDAKHGYIEVRPSVPFRSACADSNSIFLPTSSWFQKIAKRHSNSYHPLVNIKSWIRLPFGLIYGISTVAAGAGIAVGGCSLDVTMKGDGMLCKVSVSGGAAIMAKSDDVVGAALQPDLRHWERVPEGVFISQADAKTAGKCRDAAADLGLRPVL